MPTLMYANVLNASSRRGVWTSSRISGSSSSIWATMLPIGSSTSGIQTSSIPDMPRRLAFAHAPRDLRGDEDHQHAEQPPEHVLRERLGERDAALDAADRRQADHDRRPPAHVAVPLLAPGAGEHGRDDREQRARLRVELRQAECEGQRRHEEDAAADAEQARHHPGDEPDRDREHDRPHQTSNFTPSPTSKRAKSSDRVRLARRCWSAVPATAPNAAGTPTIAAAPGFSSPWNP